MATCKDCFNAELCTKWAITYDETPLWDKPIECDFFKYKSQYAEVKRGKWTLNKDGSGTCDQCHFTQRGVWDYDNHQRYCGVCGAEMSI